ncbi:effector protein [Candidatus Phytoplasma bonamiae]|uniref:Effector protein n=1 Tax=Candidatus Phytoplasma bonamiae TaxID=2982626 RepID=A0ABT9D4I1_9MOLU|nr:effector protein ['Bonamia sp.' little leaf phytoplasma]MDO8064324.1 effector protein ['Bonamia sp.' little leaf phytoplasma]
MFTLPNYLKIIMIAMDNKHSNSNKIFNDEEYVFYIQAEYAIQNELTYFNFDNQKKTELLHKKNFITTAINKYNKIKNNNQLLDQPVSFQQNIISIIENYENNSSNDNIQYLHLRKNYSRAYLPLIN